MKYDKNFEILMEYIFKSEGGYSNNKNDLGGPTDKGITQSTYNAWRKKKGLPLKNVKGVSKDEAKQLYYEEFWIPTGASKVKDLREGYLLFDMAINSGPYEAKKLYQKSDGNIYKFLKDRKIFYDNLIKQKPDQEGHRQGWYNRLKDLEMNMNEIVNMGYYSPTYQNDVTPFDKAFNDKNINNNFDQYHQKDLQNIRNKYLYLKNKKGFQTGYASPVDLQKSQSLVFTPEQIGKMTPEEFAQNEAQIMQQLKTGQIKNQSPQIDYKSFKNPQSGKTRIFTREDIEKMTTNEYSKHEKEINAQLNSIGVPHKNELPKNTKTYGEEKSQSSSFTGSQDGRWVTINGNHVFIEND